MGTNYHLAIIGGAETTEAAVFEAGGPEVVRRRVQNREFDNSVELLECLLNPLEEWLVDQEVYAAVALRALEHEPHRRAAARLMDRVLPEGCKGVLLDELEAELAGALRATPGVLFRSALQAEAATVDVDGNFRKSANPSEMLGAEGSGLWLGTRLMQVMAKMMRGRLEPSQRLLEAASQQLQVEPDGLQYRLTSRWEEHEVVSLAGVAIALADYPEPDTACRALVLQASRRLSELSHGFGEVGPLASYSGLTVRGAFLDCLQNEHPDLLWCAPDRDPIEGAVLFVEAARSQFEQDSSPWLFSNEQLWQELFRSQ